MAISVGDAVLKITGDSTELDKALKDVDGKVKSSTANWAKNFKMAGAVMVGMGTALIASLVLATKAAAEEQIGIERLRIAMGNVGLAYDGATGSLEKWIDAQQQSTAFADSQQREALASLIITTGNLTKAQEMLTIAMDLARWKDMDLVSASQLLIKVYAGNLGMLSRYGIIVKENATSTEALAQVQAMAAGQAEAYAKTPAGQMELLKNNIDDVSEAIGTTLLESLTGLVTKANEVIQAIKAWIEKNPELTLGLVIFTGILGLLLLGFGTFILLAPGILAAGTMMGVGFTAMLGPIGLIILAIAAVIAIGILLVKNWDKIVDFFTGSHREMTKVIREESAKQLKLQKEANQKMVADATAANTKTKEDLKKHYGVLEGYTKQENKTLMDLAKDASKARGKAIDIEMDALERAHTEKMRMIDEEYEAKVGALDAETNAAISALEGQLDVMDAEDKASVRTEEDMADNKRLQQIQNAILNARNVFEQKRAEKELAAFQVEMADKQKERGRVDKRESIQSQIAVLREAAANQKEALQKEHDAQIQQENDLYNAVKTRLDTEKGDLDAALQAELERIELERQAFEDAEDTKLALLQQSLAVQDAALQTFHDKEMARLTARAKSPYAGTAAEYSPILQTGWWQKFLGFMNKPVSLQGFEGIIPGIPGTPIPAIVHAGEYIGQGGGNTVNIYNPSVRSDQDITEITRQVSREMYRMQQVRHG
ncbi:MAG: phage tail tape measure protein [Dehalococcoidia bacterium]|nr:phage tail tape measure protein [Dehalococcoidia bacterium]